MSKDLVNKLYNTVLHKRKVELTQLQQEKFLWACEKSVAENPSLNFHDLTVAANVYLSFVLNFPQLDLGPIEPPEN